MVSISFEFNEGRLRHNLNTLDSRVNRAVTAVVDMNATKGQAYLKTDAPWTDRTAAARTGLHTIANSGGGSHEIIFAHAVHYGIWLEVKYSGRDAVIMPTVRKTGHELLRDLEGLMGRL